MSERFPLDFNDSLTCESSGRATVFDNCAEMAISKFAYLKISSLNGIR